jgi:hypothetical protein
MASMGAQAQGALQGHARQGCARHLAKKTSARLGFQPEQAEVSMKYTPPCLNIAGASRAMPTCAGGRQPERLIRQPFPLCFLV